MLKHRFILVLRMHKQCLVVAQFYLRAILLATKVIQERPQSQEDESRDIHIQQPTSLE